MAPRNRALTMVLDLIEKEQARAYKAMENDRVRDLGLAADWLIAMLEPDKKQQFMATAKAVELYDSLQNSYEVPPLSRECFVLLGQQLAMAIELVQLCYWKETRHINSLDSARLVTPNDSNGWLRRLLRDHGHEAVVPPENERAQKGWGW